MEDKRKFMRFDTSLDSRSRASGWFKPVKRYSVKDVSREGLKLSGKEGLSEGDVLRLDMTIPGKRAPIKATGHVVWNKGMAGSGYDIGLKFDSIKAEDKFELLDYAYSRWVESKRSGKTV